MLQYMAVDNSGCWVIRMYCNVIHANKHICIHTVNANALLDVNLLGLWQFFVIFGSVLHHIGCRMDWTILYPSSHLC